MATVAPVEGPVDPGTMAQMQGAMIFNEGMARLFTAGASPAVVTTAMQNAQQRGMIAAENIRQRYFKAEFEQVKSTRLDPLNAQLEQAKAARDQNLATTVMPVPKILGPDETQATIDQVAPPPPPTVTTVPGAPGKDGAQAQQPVTLPGQPHPNPALQGPQLNTMVTNEIPAIVDPASGQPVALSSARGIAISQNAEQAYWSTFADITKKQMDILAEYKGNPFAAQMMSNIHDGMIAMANHASTGTADPQDAQDKWEARRKFEMDQTKARSDLESANIAQKEGRQRISSNALGLEQAEGAVEVGANEGAALANNPKYSGLLGSALLDKVQNNQPLTRSDKIQLGVAASRALDLRKEELTLEKQERAGSYQIPKINVENPASWQANMQTGSQITQAEYAKRFANYANVQAGALRTMIGDSNHPGTDPAHAAELVKQAGGDQSIVESMKVGDWTNPNVVAIVQKIAQSSGAQQQANDEAYIVTLPQQEQQQPELTPIIDKALNEYIAKHWASYYRGDKAPNGKPVGPPNEALIRAERYAPFFWYTTGRMPPNVMDYATENRVLPLLQGNQPAATPTPAPVQPQRAPAPPAPAPRGQEAGAAARELGANVRRGIGENIVPAAQAIITAPGVAKDYGVGFTEGLFGISNPAYQYAPAGKLREKGKSRTFTPKR